MKKIKSARKTKQISSPAAKILTAQEERFVVEFLVDMNASAAGVRAGYTKGMTGCRLLNRPHIQVAVQKKFQELKQKTEINIEMIVKELHRISVSDVGSIFQDNNTLKNISEMPEDVRRAISSIEVDELYEGSGEDRRWIGYTKKVKFWEKIKSLELLGKHLEMWMTKFPEGNAPGGVSVGVTINNIVKPEDVTDEHVNRVRSNIAILQRYGKLDTSGSKV